MSGPTLNPEPALPEEREKLNLPPKSYADAAEETPESPDDGSNENNENRENGVNGQTAPSANGTGKYEPKHKVQESKREYSATGLDDTPKSPPRQRHRKSSSQKSNGSNENGQDANTNTMAHTQNNTKHNTAVFKNEKNGSKLISVKPSGDYEKQLQRDHSEAPKPKDEKLLFPGIKNTLLTLDTNFRIPLYREYALAMGLASVSKESCENLLSKGGPNREGMGRAITIVVGGAAESLDAQPYSLRLVLKRRKGFVKMAIRTGADLVPVLAFGENDLYDQFSADSHPWIHKFQLLVKKLMGFTIPLFHARGVFNYDVGLMPYRRPLNIVVGRPIKVIQSKTPEQQDIDRVHEEYVTELERLWDLWKDDFAPNRKGELQLVE
ncbi:Diacylglycerol O-acyltransferase 2A [Botrytis cinerea]